ncbi:nucleotidyltransferase domain-containing protein [Helcobacillus massiliensis]|uniref:nucleotidyltransferase family protein n=1 Tax=Helcobacillus massiliensis TaxID=521392 RepID=UPI0021A53F70|nr:nucleotidyltransferase domain-containing protein [Helcobacillus massiliensis]MCT1558026.1 nucleotidyltransferase domain-containing protein [Helcobacillus massiliensis]MCT2036724.1 nucleotidyltransferase domain-containing protein [Helcobacillus massiliensis]MCT2330782.1 nucleotidyltransferase domain-containing protein [Helcobacillus massiliensis]MDK7741342.1 nucleotidyltransferase domain-containing protein [Helcobacillus massiliensis]WOO92807.1 nucleotidyltransferase domain-containing protei
MSEGTVSRDTLELRQLLEARRSELMALLDRYGASKPRIFGSVARGTAGPESDIDILVEMNPADGNILMRASGLLEETRELFGRDDIDIFPLQLLKTPLADQAERDAVPL